jgi:hypothetical protein
MNSAAIAELNELIPGIDSEHDALNEPEIIEADGMLLRPVSVIVRSGVNIVWICRDINAPGQPYYTMLAVTDRSVARKLVAVLASSDKITERSPYIKSFLWGERLCYLFPYHSPRPVAEFAAGQITSPQVSEDICINLLLTSMESPLPWPLLYLEFEQEMVHVAKDNSVYLTPVFDLTGLDDSVTEATCVTACARVMLGILGMTGKKKLRSYKLLSRKVAHGAYAHFPEVYHDFKLTVLNKKKHFGVGAIATFFSEHRDTIFRIILVFSSICFVIALMMLISYLIFGDFPLFKLFGHSLNEIGTEHLNVK